MKSFRFSLWSMFLAIAAVSIACAALAKPTLMWAMSLQAASLGILFFAILAVLIYERGMARAFWIGFAVVGWGELGLQRFPFSELSVTGEIRDWLRDAIHPEQPPVPSAAEPLPADATATFTYMDSADAPPPSPPDTEYARALFPYIAVWIWPPLLGFVGGIVAQQLHFRRERRAARPPP